MRRCTELSVQSPHPIRSRCARTDRPPHEGEVGSTGSPAQHKNVEEKMRLLEGKAVVITGSGQGIGAACAKGCARRGASVVVNDIVAALASETVAAIKAEGGKAIACVADVTKWEDAG